MRKPAISKPTRFYRPSTRVYWGGFSDILFEGWYEDRIDGVLQWMRTGPCLPPITLTSHLETVVTVSDDFRHQLEASGLGITLFAPVNLKHVARVPWETWDRNADEPGEYPPEDELESYISARPHDAEAAATMGLAWEAVLRDGMQVKVDMDAEIARRVPGLIRSTWNGDHLFNAYGFPNTSSRWVVVDDVAKDWLSAHAGEWLTFKEIETF